MNWDHIYRIVAGVLVDHFGFSASELAPNTRLVGHERLDYLDMIELLIYLGEQMHLKVDGPARLQVETLGDIVDVLNEALEAAIPASTAATVSQERLP